MNINDYNDKYGRLDSEYIRLTVERDIAELSSELSNHPKVNKDWLDYARDQKFVFSGLRLPTGEDTDFYESFNGDIYRLVELLTIYKDFIICPTCGTRWTLDISISGEYGVYDQCGNVILDPKDESSSDMKYYKLPKRIETVMDLQKIIDFIEINTHKVK